MEVTGGCGGGQWGKERTEGGVRDMKTGCGYAGKIKNGGSQVVPALHKQDKTKQTKTIATGKDLRGDVGSKGKKK